MSVGKDGAKLVQYDGRKAIVIGETYQDLINYVMGNDGTVDPYLVSAWYYACVQKRASMTRAVPRRILAPGGTEISEDDLPFDIDIGDLVYRSSISLDRYAQAYWGKVFLGNSAALARIKWLDPSTITPVYDTETGALSGFTRSLKTGAVPVPYDREKDISPFMGWVWLSGMSETAPAVPPEQVAELPASILASGDKVLEDYYKRGAIAQHWITADFNPDPVTKEALLVKIKRALFGGRNTANQVDIFNEGLKVDKIGAEPGEFYNEQIDTSNKVDVAAVLQTPRLVVNPDAAANRSVMDRIWATWIEYTIVPHTQNMVNGLNRHIMKPYGDYRIELVPAAMTVSQEEERQKAQAFSLYVSGGVVPDTAAAMLGLDVPEGMELMSDEPEVPQMLPIPPQEPDAEADDSDDNASEMSDEKAHELGKLRRYVKAGNHLKRAFQSDILTRDEIAQEVGKTDDAPFLGTYDKRWFQSYP